MFIELLVCPTPSLSVISPVTGPQTARTKGGISCPGGDDSREIFADARAKGRWRVVRGLSDRGALLGAVRGLRAAALKLSGYAYTVMIPRPGQRQHADD